MIWSWILGAGDPEMEAIERLLQDEGQAVWYAAFHGKRVTPEEAYRADSVLRSSAHQSLVPADGVVTVECEVKALTNPVARIDHHRPGDPGYGVPPERFVAGSSLGQVIRTLARIRAIRSFEVLSSSSGVEEAPGELRYADGLWTVLDAGGTVRIIPEELVLAAAADHCLASAYRGACPGVAPERLMRWRIQRRAAWQRRSPQEVLADIRRAQEALKNAPRIMIGGVAVADLRGVEVPELPEAAAREGIPFIASPRVRPGSRPKIILQCAPPEALAAWPEWASEHRVTDLYGGDPERGFAGGYLDLDADARSKSRKGGVR